MLHEQMMWACIFVGWRQQHVCFEVMRQPIAAM